MKNDKDLTILIPSKERPKQLLALLGYFSARHVECKIIILESGKTYQNFIKRFLNLDLELHEFDPSIPFAHKLLSGARLIKTPLVCLCTDDDLVLIEGIEKSTEFLLGSPDYSACQGYHALFENRVSDCYLFNIHWFTPSLDSTDALQRLQNLVCRYQPVCWAVFKSEVFLRMHCEFPDIKSPLFFELYWSAMAAISGKVKRIPELFCLRTNDELLTMGHPFYLFAESPEGFCKDYLTYRSALEKALDDRSVRRILDLMHSCLFHSAATQGMLQYVTQKAVEQPEASILKPEIFNAMKLPLPRFEEKGSLTIQHCGRRYHFADQFLRPEPADEIKLSKDFHLKLLPELEKFVNPFNIT